MGETGGFTYEGLSSASRIGLVLRVYRRCRLGGCDSRLRREYWRRLCLGATCVCRCLFSSLLHRTSLPRRKAGRQSCINRDRVPHASRFSHWHSHRNLPSGKYVAVVDSRANRRVVARSRRVPLKLVRPMSATPNPSFKRTGLRPAA